MELGLCNSSYASRAIFPGHCSAGQPSTNGCFCVDADIGCVPNVPFSDGTYASVCNVNYNCPAAKYDSQFGFIDTCQPPAVSSYSSSGCPCKGSCSVHPEFNAQDELGPGTTTCEVHISCWSNYGYYFNVTSSRTTYWDLCNGATTAPASGPAPTYCELHWSEPACLAAAANASSSGASLSPAQKLGLYVSDGTNGYTFSFANSTAFSNAIFAGKGAEDQSSARSGLLSFISPIQFNRILYTSASRAMLAILVLCAISIYLLSFCTALTTFLNWYFALVRSILFSCAGSTPPKKGKKSGTVEVPFSRALAGEEAFYKYTPMLLGSERTYDIVAQNKIFRDLGLLPQLKEAHPSLQPKHLLFAAEDGVFGNDVKGLTFMIPYFWNSNEHMRKSDPVLLTQLEKDFGAKIFEGGYKARLKQWFDDASSVSGGAGLDHRFHGKSTQLTRSANYPHACDRTRPYHVSIRSQTQPPGSSSVAAQHARRPRRSRPWWRQRRTARTGPSAPSPFWQHRARPASPPALPLPALKSIAPRRSQRPTLSRPRPSASRSWAWTRCEASSRRATSCCPATCCATSRRASR